jgi:hypothetical protein
VPWFVVAEYPENMDKKNVWTVSQHPEYTGWDTDSSFPNYGLSKTAAQFLADAANEKETRDGSPFPMMLPYAEYD